MCRQVHSDITMFLGDSCKVASSIRKIDNSKTVIVKFGEEYGSTVSLFCGSVEQARALIEPIYQKLQYIATEVAPEDVEV